MTFKLWFLALLFCSRDLILVEAHNAIDCFQTLPLKGGSGTTDILVESTDLNRVDLIDIDHTIKTVKVCTDRKEAQILGVQISYGKLDEASGEISEAVSMNSHGNVQDATGIC